MRNEDDIQYYIKIDTKKRSITLANMSKDYKMGELLIEFLDTDFSEYEEKRQEILEILTDENKLKNELFKNKGTIDKFQNKENKTFTRGYETLHRVITHTRKDKSDEEVYVILKLSKLIEEEKHPYFSVFDLSLLGEVDCKKMLEDNMDLINMQKTFKHAIDHCLYMYNKEFDNKKVSALERYHRYINEKNTLIEDYYVRSFYDVVEVNNDEYRLVEKYRGDICSLLYIEFITMVRLNIYVNRCENCGGYFTLKGLYNCKFCDRAQENGMTCRRLSATSKYKDKLKNDPIYREHEKTYRRIYGRKRINTINEIEFKELQNKIERLKNDVIESKITFDEYKSILVQI